MRERECEGERVRERESEGESEGMYSGANLKYNRTN